MADKQSKQPPSQKVSSLLMKQYLKWLDEGDPRIITMWRHDKPHIREADQKQIMAHFAQVSHSSRNQPKITDDMVEEWIND
jgi:hypothetical protein